MSEHPFRSIPLGDSAITVEFGNEISVPLNEMAIGLYKHFLAHPFPGFIESVPAYSSTTIYYDLLTVRKNFSEFPTAFKALEQLVNNAISSINCSDQKGTRAIEIPVHFSSEAGPDLPYVAEQSGLTVEEVITIFTETTYRVFMLGFLPGFAYMGEVDERIATPRRSSPRLKVPKGSVGIAGKQTGIYSLVSPGGWQIIGRTDIEMFSPYALIPCKLAPADRVRFLPIR